MKIYQVWLADGTLVTEEWTPEEALRVVEIIHNGTPDQLLEEFDLIWDDFRNDLSAHIWVADLVQAQPSFGSAYGLDLTFDEMLEMSQ